MSKIIRRKKESFIKFILKHKLLFAGMVLFVLCFALIPFVFNPVKAEEEPINLSLKNENLENSADNRYIIDSVDDFIVLQEYSKNNDCYGMYFTIGDNLKNTLLSYSKDEEEDEEGSEDGGITYNLNLVGTIVLEDGTKATFGGISPNYNIPFRGDILFNGISIRIDTPLFGFIASGASITGVHLFGDIIPDKMNNIVGGNATLGALTSMALLDGTESLDISTVGISNNTSIVGTTKSVGGLIGTVIGNPIYKSTINYGYSKGYTYEGDKINAETTRFTLNLDKITIADAISLVSTGTRSNDTRNIDTNKGMLLSNFPGYTGGIIGDVLSTDGNYYVDVNFTGTTLVKGELINTNAGSGGVIGHTFSKVRVKFDGDIDVSEITKISGYSTKAYSGYLIGSISRYSLAYMTNGHIVKKPIIKDLEQVNEIDVDHWGSTLAGTVYRNTPESFFVNEVKISGIGTKEDPYIINSSEDMERLSVLLCTSGRYGIWINSETGLRDSWFNVPETNKTSVTTILKYVKNAHFLITADINLAEKNIVRLNRFNNLDESYFAGSIIGKQGSYKDGNEFPTLTINVTEFQENVALIPYAAGRLVDGVPVDCEYKNFNIEGNVEGRAAVYGLIYRIGQYNTAYSDYTFENIKMNLNMNQKLSNSSNMSGFVGEADYREVTANLSEGLKLNFNNIKYNGTLLTNSSGSSYGAVLVGAYTAPGNDMTNPEDINNFEINISNYEFTGEIRSTSQNGLRVGALIYSTTNVNNKGYKNYPVAGRNTSFGKTTYLNVNNVKITDSKIVNGSVGGELGGIIGYSWGWVTADLKNIVIKNFTHDATGGYGAVFLSSNSSTVHVDGLTYDNVTLIRSSAGPANWQYNSTMLWSCTGAFLLKNHTVTNSKVYSYAARANYTETHNGGASYDSNVRIDTYGLYSLEGNAPNGEKYTPINSYQSPYVYTDITDHTKDYKASSYIGSRVQYNVLSNMEGEHISGTGTMADPFIIDNEAKLVVFSDILTRQSTSLWKSYFSDINEIFTSEELTFEFTKKNAMIAERILTGVYVFANDMDLSEYSYYPTCNATGKYYGFNVYKYKDVDNLDDETLRVECAKAISVLESESTVDGLSLEMVNNHKPEIKFAAEKVAGGVLSTASVGVGYGWNKPTSTYGIHMDLHSGLFGPITGGGNYSGTYKRGTDVRINNILLTGMIGTRNENNLGTGAFLVTGANNYPAIYQANVDIKNIDFKDAIIIQRSLTGTDWTYACGLLIDTIYNSDVNISKVKILQDENGNANIRADALIGYQYGTSCKVIFRDIDLNAVIDPGTIVISEEEVDGETIETATIETTKKEGSWRSAPTNTDESTMTEEQKKQLAAFKKYGYGFRYGYYYYHLKEGAAIYYYDVGVDIVTPGRFDSDGEQIIQNKLLLKQVQKYAYKVVNVDVNPENANITKGSGTEDDPYIIDNVGQLLTLANFIKYEGDIIDYESWWVGETDGTTYDKNDTDTWANDANVLYKNRYISSTEDYRLNAVKHLSSSYYKIVTDIDFSDPNSPFSSMAESFNGIGTSSYPFSGGLIGQTKTDGTNPKIIVGNSSKSYQNTFGLIWYGKGFEVSDLIFENGYVYEETIDELTGVSTYTVTDEKNKIYLSQNNTTAGTVASNIVGGDNIIRNVEVNVQMQKYHHNTAQYDNNIFYVGGYVGYMTRGTLKIAGINSGTFNDFNIGVGDDMKLLRYDTGYNKYVSAIVGRVDSVNIIYDSDNAISSDIIEFNTDRVVTATDDGKQVCKVSELGYYNEYGVGCNRGINILNQSYLDTIEPIKVVYDTRENNTGTLIANIENEKQLYLYSVAIRSGSLSSSTDGYYMNKSSCKKDEEEWTEWLARENNGKDEDSKIVLNDDYDFPAIFKYFDFTALDNSYKSTIYNGYSMLNMVYSTYQNGNIYRTTWMLTGDIDTYDMSVYGTEFNGIGTRMHAGFSDWDTTKYTSLNANFDGNGKTIKVAISDDVYTGLFTTLNTQNNNNSPFIIGNFTLEGSVTQGNGINGPVGGVAAYLRDGWYTFDNIKLQNLVILNENTNTSGTAGILGTYDRYGQVRFNRITIGDKLSDNKSNVSISAPLSNGASVGGLISSSPRLLATDIDITNTKISSNGSVGGLAGGISNQHASTVVDDINITDCTFETLNVNYSVGAAIGHMSANINNNFIAMHDINVKDNSLIAPEGCLKVGRVVGSHNDTNYCKREILKLTDLNSEEFTGPTSDVVWNCLVSNELENCDYIYYNDFCDLEEAEKLYGIDRTATDSEGKDLVRYNECYVSDLFTIPDGDDEDLNPDPVDLITATPDMMDNYIISWSSDCGSLENVINSVINTLTNGTGLLNNGINDKITVTVEPMQVLNGVVSPRADGVKTLSIEKIAGQFVFANNNKYDTFEKINSETGEHTPGTFSLVHIKYTIGSNTFSEEITIPIFISNMVKVDIYSKIKIGQEYDKDVMRAIQRTSEELQETTKDSSYTVYTEFMYSANRIDFDEELYMNKGFKKKQDQDSDPYIEEGTKLTLIDLTFEDDPKVYYYELDKKELIIPLSWFKDENGVSYKERNINILDRAQNGLPVTNVYTTMYVNQKTHTKYNRGIEKYLLFVDCTNVKNIENSLETTFSAFVMDGVASGQNEVHNKDVFYIKYRAYNKLSTYNVRNIQFVDDSVITEGEISKEKQLNVKVTFEDKAPDERYWNRHKLFDYNNMDKYVEVAIYLKNEAGDKVMLPSGTRIKYGDSEKVYEAVKNTSAIFYFKDGLQEGYELMAKTEDSETTLDFTLDFTYAKMDKLPSGNYTVCFDLVRTTDENYPMGDDMLDTIESKPIGVTTNAEYGFRLDTNGKDTLAFNLADIVEDQKSEVNFGIMLNSTLPIDIAGTKKATIKLALYKKDETSGNFVNYKDTDELKLSDIDLEVKYNNVTEKMILNEGEYEYVFNGISGISQEAMKVECKLSFPYEADINNYKFQAELYIDGYKQASDFFIVNISNISH